MATAMASPDLATFTLKLNLCSGNAIAAIQLLCSGPGQRTRSPHDRGGLPEEHLLGVLRHRGADGRVHFLRLLIGPDRRRARLDRLEPALEVREIVEVLPLALIRNDPRIRGHVGDGL